MEYNTELNRLIIPEYGRNVQKMVAFALTIEDRAKRNEQAQAIIEVMGNLNPHLRDVPDFKHKLWDHLFIMSEFELDVDSPYPKPSAENFEGRPEIIPYPDRRIRYRHYGKTIGMMIAEAKKMEDSDHKDKLILAIANHMKKLYLTWNKTTVEDSVILEQLNVLSDGELVLKEELQLSHFATVQNNQSSGSNQSNNNGGKRKYRKNGSNNNSNRRRN